MRRDSTIKVPIESPADGIVSELYCVRGSRPTKSGQSQSSSPACSQLATARFLASIPGQVPESLNVDGVVIQCTSVSQ